MIAGFSGMLVGAISPDTLCSRSTDGRAGRGLAASPAGVVGTGKIAPVVDNARRARVDEAAHAVLAATLENRPRAEHVGAEEIFVAALK